MAGGKRYVIGGRDATALGQAAKQIEPGRTLELPIHPQHVQQPLAEHDEAVAAPLATAHMDQHARAVDVLGLERADLGDA